MLSDTVLISFAGSDIHKQYQEKLHSDYRMNFLMDHRYDLDWIKREGYYDKYNKIFSYQKYAGYFLWKPIIILDAMRRYPMNNVLYCDANLYFKDFITFVSVFKTQIRDQECFLVKHWNRLNKDWTKRDTFISMQSDTERYHNALQVWAVIQGYAPSMRPLVEEYFKNCLDENSLTDLPNVSGANYLGFTAHRWDQSILSILVEKYKIGTVSDIEMIKLFDKDYNQSLIQLKEEVDKDPLKKV